MMLGDNVFYCCLFLRLLYMYINITLLRLHKRTGFDAEACDNTSPHALRSPKLQRLARLDVSKKERLFPNSCE